MKDWVDGTIAGCEPEPLRLFSDGRGWLSEVFRDDELPNGVRPAMAYVSETLPGVARGPHAHEDQTDVFAFFDGRFRVFLWDAREGSPTAGVRMVFEAGRDHPARLVVPPGVVHAYRNLGTEPALIVNCPDRLYGGPGRAQAVDEIRYEDHPDAPFRLDDDA